MSKVKEEKYCKECVEEIKKAKDNNKLVIFVGAGVSKNSGLPDWGELIQKFADDIGYKFRKDSNGNNIIDSNEYLKIPEFYLKKYGKEKYKEKIKAELDKKECEPNKINEIIYKLNPKHIVTTNYDKLIENTQVPERVLFEVIYKDQDFLNSDKNNFIIKMHGDIEDLDNIVLKEDDYLNYTQKHMFIETYLKSLLVSNTFLFIGYSLNDYNLKIIMNWVESLIDDDNKNSNNRQKHFIIQEVNENKEYIQEYYKSKNIYLIDPREIQMLYNKKVEGIENEFGKRLYNCLDYINKYPTNIKDRLYLNLQCFKNRNYVSFTDLQKTGCFDDALDCVCYVWDLNELRDEDEKTEFIKNIFDKTCLKKVEVLKVEGLNNKRRYVFWEKNKELNNELLELEQKCDYKKIKEIAEKEDKDYMKKSYCNFLLYNFEEAKKIINEKEYEIKKIDTYDLLLQKLNLFALNFWSYQNKYGIEEYKDVNYVYSNIKTNNRYDFEYIYDIFRGSTAEIAEMLKYKENFEDKPIESNFKEIQMRAYNYYYYIKLNYIMIDFQFLPKEYFESYIEAMLFTYSTDECKTHKLNLIDINILIKYCDNENLEKFFKEFNIKKLELEFDKEDIEEIGLNLLDSLKENRNDKHLKYLNNYLYLLAHCEVGKENFKKILEAVQKIIVKDESIMCINLNLLFKGLDALITNNVNEIQSTDFKILINKVLDDLGVKDNKNNGLFREILYELLSIIKPGEYKEKINAILNTNDIDKINCILSVLDDKQKETLRNSEIKDKLILEINNEIQETENEKLGSNYKLKQLFRYIIKLYSYGIIDDLDDFKDSIWEIVILDKDLIKDMNEDTKERVLKKLRKNIDAGYATEKQIKAYNKYCEN